MNFLALFSCSYLVFRVFYRRVLKLVSVHLLSRKTSLATNVRAWTRAKSLEFCFALHRDWFIEPASTSQPIRGKTKNSSAVATRVFPRLKHFTLSSDWLLAMFSSALIGFCDSILCPLPFLRSQGKYSEYSRQLTLNILYYYGLISLCFVSVGMI